MPGIPTTSMTHELPVACAPLASRTRRKKKCRLKIRACLRDLFRRGAVGRQNDPWIESDFNAAGMRSTLRNQFPLDERNSSGSANGDRLVFFRGPDLRWRFENLQDKQRRTGESRPCLGPEIDVSSMVSYGRLV